MEKVTEVQLTDDMLDIASRAAGFRDGLIVAVDLIREGAPFFAPSVETVLLSFADAVKEKERKMIQAYASALEKQLQGETT